MQESLLRDSFREDGDRVGPAGAGQRGPRRRLILGVVALAAAVFVTLYIAVLRPDAERVAQAAAPPVQVDATLVIETQPAGWHVWDGEVDRGVTPLTLKLPPGRRTLALRRGTLTRDLAVELSPGARVVHHLELAGAPTIGDLHVQTIPPGAIVAVDGIGRGTTPVLVRDLKAGSHVVTLLKGDRIISQDVTVAAGARGSLVVPLAEAGAPAVGWVAIKSDVDLEVYEGESLIGSSRNPRLLLMPGRHALRFVNRDLNVELARDVDVRPGVTSNVPVALPSGRLSLNATPWAEVLVDGDRIGETPIADRQVTVGTHDIVFRHPTLGERRRTIVVTAGAPVRLGVDLRREDRP